MGYFDGMTGAMIRKGADGARYYAPLGKFGKMYAIPDDAASARVQARWRAFYLTIFGLMMVGAWVSQGDWRIVLLAPLVGLLAVPFGSWAARGLPPAVISFSDLPPVTRAEALTTYSRATGRRTLGLVLGASLLMTVVGIVTAWFTGQASLWLSAGFFFLCSVNAYRAYSRAG